MLKLLKNKKKIKEDNYIPVKRFTPWDVIKEIVSLCKNKDNKNFNILLEDLINKINDKELNLKYILNHCFLANNGIEIRMNIEQPIFVSTFLSNKDYVKFLVYYLINNCNNISNFNIFYKLDLRKNIISKELIEKMEKNDIDLCSELNKTPLDLYKKL